MVSSTSRRLGRKPWVAVVIGVLIVTAVVGAVGLLVSQDFRHQVANVIGGALPGAALVAR